MTEETKAKLKKHITTLMTVFSAIPMKTPSLISLQLRFVMETLLSSKIPISSLMT